MKMSKKIIALALCAAMLLFSCGCDMFTLNEEKDAKSTVATIDKTDYTKSEFLSFYKSYLLLYEAYGYTLPTAEVDVNTLKSDIFDSWVMNLIKKAECTEAGASVTEESVNEASAAFVTQAKSTTKTDEAYAALLAKYDYTAESVEAGMKPFFELQEYANIYTDADSKTDYSAIGSKIAGVVDSEYEIKMADLYFYVMAQEAMISAYSSSSSLPQTEAEIAKFYEDCYTYLVDGVKAMRYCDSKGIEITEEDIAEAMSSFNVLESYYGADYFTNLAESYYINAEQYTAAHELCGKAAAAQAHVNEEYLATLTITDEDLLAYYEENLSTFDPDSTVSAYHILSTDADFIAQLEAETGGTAEGFMAVYEKYKVNEKVREATDLGSFNRAEMEKSFSDCAFALPLDGIGTCTTSYGTHLVYVYEKDDKGVNYESVADKVRTNYENAKISDGGTEYFAKATEAFTAKANDYNVYPSDAAQEFFYEKHNVTVKLKAVLR